RCVTLLLGAYELLLAQIAQHGGDRGVGVLGSEPIDDRAHRQGVALPQQVHHLCLEVAEADCFAGGVVVLAARSAARHGAVSAFSCGVGAAEGSGQELWAGSRRGSASRGRMGALMARTGWIGASHVTAQASPSASSAIVFHTGQPTASEVRTPPARPMRVVRWSAGVVASSSPRFSVPLLFAVAG